MKGGGGRRKGGSICLLTGKVKGEARRRRQTDRKGDVGEGGAHGRRITREQKRTEARTEHVEVTNSSLFRVRRGGEAGIIRVVRFAGRG